MTDQEELEALFSMHTGVLTAKRRDHLREVFARVLAAAESRGYERAREQAATLADTYIDGHEPIAYLPDRIRAMTGERARGEESACESCGTVDEPRTKGPVGTYCEPCARLPGNGGEHDPS